MHGGAKNIRDMIQFGKRFGHITMLDPIRAVFDGSVTARELKKLTRRKRLEVLQCSVPVPDKVWTLVNECFSAARPDVEVRVYRHDSAKVDLSFARRLSNVRKFAADCLTSARSVEAIEAIPELESLSLGVYDLTDFHVLERISARLKVLKLHATRSRKPSLASLSRFRSLRVLYLEGHSKGIEVLSDMSNLEDLLLRSITTPDLSYLAPLNKLWSLDIKLGGIRCFQGIEGKDCIKYLELWQIRNLGDVDVIGTLPGLQNLFLQSLRHVSALPRLDKAAQLRRICLEDMKGLMDFSALKTAPALEEFLLVAGNKQQPEQLRPVLENPRVRRIGAGFGSDRKKRVFARLRDEHGKAEWKAQPFVYV
jgi:hypothetical protein